MKALAKKATIAVLAFSSVALAAGIITKEEVNKKVAAIAAPFNNDKTSIELAFTDLNINERRTLDFGVAANIRKIGEKNELILKADDIAYHFGNGWNPTVTGRLSVKLDLVKALGQTALNEYAADLERMVQDFAASYTQQYGEAITVRAKVEELKKDAQGNVESAKIRLAAAINFNKLPAGMNAEDVEFKNFAARLSITRTGLGGGIRVTLNPLNKSFNPEEPGLKEWIEKLLNDDQQTYEQIGEMVALLNNLGDALVNMDASEDGSN